MEELAKLKSSIEEAQRGQFEARKEFALKFAALGYSLYREYRFPHPTEERETVYIHIQDCMGNPENTFNGFFHAEIQWSISCQEYGCEDFDCDGEHIATRPATAEEIVGVLRKDLLAWAEAEWKEKERNDTLAEALPNEEVLAKIRRKVEDVIRKDKKKIIPIAKLLDII